jgi:hypothetical protein
VLALVSVALSIAPCAVLGQYRGEPPWSPDQAVLANADFHGDSVMIEHIRNCIYRTTDDYTVGYYDRTIELAQVRSVDFIVAPFAETPTLAHTMLSFGIDDGTYIAVSIELRKRQGDQYSPLLAMFPRYEIMYVVGDERDLIQLRTNYRHDGVYVYATRATPAAAQRLFVSMMRRVDKLEREPEFYNTIMNNCTTNIRRHINEIAPNKIPYDQRVLLPGLSDRLAYDLGLLDTNESFEQTREKARVNYLANLYRDAPDFSQRIREGRTATLADHQIGRPRSQ